MFNVGRKNNVTTLGEISSVLLSPTCSKLTNADPERTELPRLVKETARDSLTQLGDGDTFQEEPCLDSTKTFHCY